MGRKIKIGVAKPRLVLYFYFIFWIHTSRSLKVKLEPYVHLISIIKYVVSIDDLINIFLSITGPSSMFSSECIKEY